MSNRACTTCRYRKVLASLAPCKTCAHRADLPCWELDPSLGRPEPKSSDENARTYLISWHLAKIREHLKELEEMLDAKRP